MSDIVGRSGSMKKGCIGCLIVALIPILILCILIIPQTNTRNADAVISRDYSIITYNDEIYVPIDVDALPKEVAKEFYFNWADKEKVEATVELSNYFLDKFLTNQLYLIEFEGETFIYLNTDYDVNESDYYCTKRYNDKVKSK